MSGPGRLSFFSRAAISPLTAWDSLPILESSNSRWWGRRSADWREYVIDTIPPGNQLLTWPVSSQSGIGTVSWDEVKFTAYNSVPLSEALDGSGMTFSSPGEHPWRGYAAGTGAADGVDCAMSDPESPGVLELTMPAGDGILSFRTRSQGGTLEMLGQGWTSMLPTPESWKRHFIDIEISGPRTIRFAAPQSRSVWMDDVNFTALSPFANWLRSYRLPLDSAPDHDADGDGAGLMLEYALNLNPFVQDASTPLRVEYVINADGTHQLVCRYFKRTSTSGLNYEVFFTGDTGPLPPTQNAFEIVEAPAGDRLVEVTARDIPFPAGSQSRRFVRVRVTTSP